MDFNSVMQTVLTIMVGALCWFIQRSIKKFDDGIAKLDEKISNGISKLDEKIALVEEKAENEAKQLRQEFNNFQKDLPLVYSLREDTLRFMSSIEDKINKLLYSKGETHHE